MEIDAEEPQNVLPFQLQFDKPITFQIKIAEWNPEKDLLAMVTEDSKILLHRFNWQRLWTISPGKCVMSLCWRPDGKAIAVGLEDGSISLHDVENGKLLKSVKSHTVAVVCLNWVEDGQDRNNYSTYEDRTHRFFPPAPRAPRASGVVSGDAGFMDDSEETNGELSSSSCQRFNILCSGDKDGNICFSIFGIFLIGKVNVHKFSISLPPEEQQVTVKLLNASICKIALSKDLCRLIVMCSGELTANMVASVDSPNAMFQMHGLHGLVLDTSIFWKRKNELHQLAQQASNIEDLTDITRSSLSVMSKQWSDAMRTFRDKFNSLSSLIADYALDSTPQEEFLSLLGGAQISPAVHQFLVNTLGEVGVKRVAKVISSAGKELQRIILEHLQPAAEIIGFRIGELCGLSRWRSRFQGIGLDELLMDNATEKSGMMLVQVERFMEIVSSVEQQFSNFFNWLLKCIKLLMQQPIDQLPPYNSELIVVFLKFLYDQDPIRQMLEQSDAGHEIAVDFETMQRVKELVQFGGFSDCDYLRRSLAREFQQLEFSFKEAFLMPFSTISRKIVCVDLLPLFPLPSSPSSTMIPMSMANYEDSSEAVTSDHTHQCGFVDYICFQVPTEPFPETSNIVCVMRGVTHKKSSSPKGHNSLEAVLLAIPAGYDCVDLSLYKDMQVVLLLNGTNGSLEGDACIMIVQSSELPFVDISRCEDQNLWKLNQLKDSIVQVETDDVKVRQIPHSVIAPLVISASRGLACVFATRKRALVYILEEDEEEIPDIE